MIGTTLKPYEITALPGEGGMGVVYRAHDRHLQRSVAVSVLRGLAAGASERRQRFIREARLASTLNHQNVRWRGTLWRLEPPGMSP